MKKILFVSLIFLLASAFTFSAEPSLRVGKTAVSAHLGLGQNREDSIAQLGTCVEYGVFSHLSVGIGYAYVDGRYPIQAHGLDLFVKGYVFDTIVDIYGFDIYGKAGSQIYYQDDFGLAYTFLAGVEWQSLFKLFLAIETGAELENGDWGHFTGGVIGMRF